MAILRRLAATISGMMSEPAPTSPPQTASPHWYTLPAVDLGQGRDLTLPPGRLAFPCPVIPHSFPGSRVASRYRASVLYDEAPPEILTACRDLGRHVFGDGFCSGMFGHHDTIPLRAYRLGGFKFHADNVSRPYLVDAQNRPMLADAFEVDQTVRFTVRLWPWQRVDIGTGYLRGIRASLIRVQFVGGILRSES